MSEREVVFGSETNGVINTPVCCGQKMKDDGGCSDGCCDDWKCEVCGKRIRTEYGD